MVARVIVLALAVVLAGYAVIERHDSRKCTDKASIVLRAAFGEVHGPGYVDSFLDACRGSHLLAIAAVVLARRGRLSPAIRVADETIRREPDNFEGWLALSVTLRRRGLDGAAKRAFAHVRELNPRYGQPPD